MSRAQIQDGKIRVKDGQLVIGPDDSCCCSPCAYCSGTLPMQLQLDVSGVTNGTCGSCTSINGTYVLDYYEPNGCYWQYAIGTICGLSVCNAFIHPTFGVVVNIATLQFILSGSPPWDCASFDGLTIPWNNLGDLNCSAASATVTLTAL